MKALHMITWILLVIGGLNWGLEGAFNWGIGSFLGPGFANLIYVLVGLSAIYELLTHGKRCKNCGTQGMATPGM